MRPQTLDDVVGQDHLVAPGAPLRRMVESGHLVSMVFWGPPGTGKTTLARIVARGADYELDAVSAVAAGVKEVREALDRARRRLGEQGRRTVLFIDEVHRFSKSQQDLLLPATEHGDVTLMGATTENPFFEVNAALMSRTTLWRLVPLTDESLNEIVERARRHCGIELDDDARQALVASADGDARSALTTLETAILIRATPGTAISRDDVARARDGRVVHQNEDTHYDQVSALIKSIRGSDPDAAVFWLVSLLEAGESARFLARRLVILASEDVGLADSQALVIAEAAARAVEFVGLPEARLNLTHATLALALAPKSNSATTALARASAAVRAHGSQVPTHLRDGHYASAATVGHGVDYVYPHSQPEAWVDQQYLPDGAVSGDFYEPTRYGAELELVKQWRRRRGELVNPEKPPVE